MIPFLFVSLSFSTPLLEEHAQHNGRRQENQRMEKSMGEFSDFATRRFFLQSAAFLAEQSGRAIALKIKPRPSTMNKEPPKNVFYFSQKIPQNIHGFEILISTIRYFVSAVQRT